MFRNKHMLAIGLMAVIMITSLALVSAADASDTVKVKIIWDDNNADRPDFVTVDLIKDGQKVDTAILEEKNSWNWTFEIDGDGNYEINQAVIENYESKITGNADEGFEIRNTLTEDDVLGSAESVDEVVGDIDDSGDEVVAGSDDSGDEVVAGSDDSVDDVGADENTANETSQENSTDDNSTDNENATVVSEDENTPVNTTTTKTVTTTKIIKHKDNKPQSNTTDIAKKTGLPLIVLVIAVFAAVFIPISRRK